MDMIRVVFIEPMLCVLLGTDGAVGPCSAARTGERVGDPHEHHHERCGLCQPTGSRSSVGFLAGIGSIPLPLAIGRILEGIGEHVLHG